MEELIWSGVGNVGTDIHQNPTEISKVDVCNFEKILILFLIKYKRYTEVKT